MSRAAFEAYALTPRERPAWRETVVFFAVFAVLLLGAHLLSGKPFERPHTDASRYIDYAVSLHEFGVFGLTIGDHSKAPAPSNANAPLYPAYVAGLMWLDPGLKDSIYCWNERDPVTKQLANDICDVNVAFFLVVQGILAIVTLLLVFLLTLKLTKRPAVAWIAAFLAWSAGILAEFQVLFMTEIFVLPLFIGMMLCIARAYSTRHLVWIGAIGVLLGVLTLTRPTYLYLFYGFVLFFLVYLAIARNRIAAVSLTLLVVSFAAVTAPWSLRNKAQLDTWALSGGDYAEIVLMQRFTYNRMGWPEVATAFVYYLPDFGDSLSAQLFPARYYDKLGWEGESYYRVANDRQEFLKEAEKAGGKENLIPYWIRTEMIGNAPKNLAVSAALAWRGSFVAKYWGLVGAIAFVALLIATIRQRSYMLLLVSAPVLYMIAFHAGLSVSIPRYNLPIMALCATAMAYYIGRVSFDLMTRNDFPAKKYREAFNVSA